jgi:hypothetical protein
MLGGKKGGEVDKLRKIIMCLLIFIFIAACQSKKVDNSLTENVSTIVTPIQGITTIESKYSWPSSVKIITNDKNICIEVSMFIRDTCLRLDITAYGFKWPNSTKDNIINWLLFYDDSTDNPLTIEEVIRGGGGGGEGLEAQTEEMYTYDIKSTNIPIYITAIISFNEIFKLDQPVRVTLKPISRPNMQCPQLPSTTPEG